MKSLVSLFRNSGSRNSSSPAREENEPPKTYERQQSMPLSRFVVDPLAGSRRSRQGTPPPDHVKPEWRRSISMDTKNTSSGGPSAKQTPPPLPTGKPCKLARGIGNSTQTCRSTEQGVVKPYDNWQGKTFLGGQGLSLQPAAPSTTSSPQSKAKKPLMPPSKKKITSMTIKTKSCHESFLESRSSSKTTQGSVKGSPKRPVLPPSKGPTETSRVIVCGSAKQQSDRELPRTSKGGGRVKDLARKLEKP